MQIGVGAHLNGIAWSSEFRTVVQRLVVIVIDKVTYWAVWGQVKQINIFQCKPSWPWQLHMSTRQMGRSIHKSTCLRRWPIITDHKDECDPPASGHPNQPDHKKYKRKYKHFSDKKPVGLEAKETSLTSRASNLFHAGILASTTITAILSLCWMFLSESRGLQILDVFQLVLSTWHDQHFDNFDFFTFWIFLYVCDVSPNFDLYHETNPNTKGWQLEPVELGNLLGSRECACISVCPSRASDVWAAAA